MHQPSPSEKLSNNSLTDRLNLHWNRHNSAIGEGYVRGLAVCCFHVRTSHNASRITEFKSYQITCHCETMNVRRNDSIKCFIIASHRQQATGSEKIDSCNGVGCQWFRNGYFARCKSVPLLWCRRARFVDGKSRFSVGGFQFRSSIAQTYCGHPVRPRFLWVESLGAAGCWRRNNTKHKNMF